MDGILRMMACIAGTFIIAVSLWMYASCKRKQKLIDEGVIKPLDPTHEIKSLESDQALYALIAFMGILFFLFGIFIPKIQLRL